MTPLLRTLLKYSKQPVFNKTWQDVALVLAPTVLTELTLEGVVHMLIEAYTEVIGEPRFQMGQSTAAASHLIFAPIKGYHAMEVTEVGLYSVDQFYNAMVAHLLAELRLTTVSWCKDELMNDFHAV